MTRFMPMVLTAFLARVKPVSRSAKPACMNMTRKPPSSTQATLSDCTSGSVISPLPRDGDLNLRPGLAGAQPDQRREAGEDGQQEQRRAEPPREAAPPAGPGREGQGVARRHRGGVF